MKLTRPQADCIIQVLKDVLINHRFADRSFEFHFKNSTGLSTADRGSIVTTTYDIIRFARLLEACSGSTSLWRLLGSWLILSGASLPDWKEFKSIDPDAIKAKRKEAESLRSVRESIPDWLDEVGQAELGELWNRELRALNKRPTLTLRVNRLKTTHEELQATLAKQSIATIYDEQFPDALLIKGYADVFQSEAFANGWFEVQDAHSQCVAPFVQATPGSRIIDACAGTGGKSLHLASIMQNKGKLIALDITAGKLDQLKKRANRAGVHNLETKLIESTKTLKRLHGTADCVLLDVPCSGLGVLKRNPDAKWRLKPEHVKKLLNTQREILENYWPLVKPGGMLIYATCSIMPSENENQVAHFLESHNDRFELQAMNTLYPSSGHDGFYMARLHRLR